MSQRRIIDNYEDLLTYTEEVRESLDLIYEWLKNKPDFDDYWSYHNLIALHGSNFALLNLIMHRMDSLIAEHREIIEKTIQGEN